MFSISHMPTIYYTKSSFSNHFLKVICDVHYLSKRKLLIVKLEQSDLWLSQKIIWNCGNSCMHKNRNMISILVHWHYHLCFGCENVFLSVKITNENSLSKCPTKCKHDENDNKYGREHDGNKKRTPSFLFAGFKLAEVWITFNTSIRAEVIKLWICGFEIKSTIGVYYQQADVCIPQYERSIFGFFS